MSAALQLRLDTAALTANWRWLAARSGAAACGAAVKADGYGLGARAVVEQLAKAGCRDFFVATWDEAASLGRLPEGTALSVLHGVRAEDMPAALASPARPVLNTLAQVAHWRETGRACDVMVDTGMNRLGLSVADMQSGALAGLKVETLMSHLACADEDVPANERQRAAFAALAGQTSARRMSLANSAGICLGSDYAFDLTRPGLALYGGIPRAEAAGHIAQVVTLEAQVLQVRRVRAGESVGYGATWTACADTDVAILNLGYADGYLRSFAPRGTFAGGRFTLAGRVSMDLVAVATDGSVGEGDWLPADWTLSEASAASGLSPYELLTGLSQRAERM